jgi:hypothetical protein
MIQMPRPPIPRIHAHALCLKAGSISIKSWQLENQADKPDHQSGMRLG